MLRSIVDILSFIIIYKKCGLSSITVFSRSLVIAFSIFILQLIIIKILPDEIISNNKENILGSLASSALTFWAVYGYLRKEFVSKFLMMRDYLYKITDYDLSVNKNIVKNERANIIYKMNYVEDCLMTNLENHQMFRYYFMYCIYYIIKEDLINKENISILRNKNSIKPYELTENYIANIRINNAFQSEYQIFKILFENENKNGKSNNPAS